MKFQMEKSIREKKAADLIIRAKNESWQTLDLRRLYLSTLPSQIGELPFLQNLYLQDNQLTEITESVVNLSSLRNLNAARNNLETIPESIGRLRKLQILDVHDNKITSLPLTISDLGNLRVLNISHNQVSDISAITPDLVNLKYLNISSNQIADLSANINDLPRLQVLNANSNLETSEAKIISFYTISTNSSSSSKKSQSKKVSITLLTEEMSSSGAIKGHILDLAEDRRLVSDFLEQDGLENFNSFLYQCPSTAGWIFTQDVMLESLLEIITKASQDSEIKERCELIASQSRGEPGNPTTLAFVKMQILTNYSDRNLEEMNPLEVQGYAWQELVQKFLNNKAEEQIRRSKDSSISPDDIRLSYLQMGQNLGLEIKGGEMFLRENSTLNNQDSVETVEEFFALDLKREVRKEISRLDKDGQKKKSNTKALSQEEPSNDNPSNSFTTSRAPGAIQRLGSYFLGSCFGQDT